MTCRIDQPSTCQNVKVYAKSRTRKTETKTATETSHFQIGSGIEVGEPTMLASVTREALYRAPNYFTKSYLFRVWAVHVHVCVCVDVCGCIKYTQNDSTFEWNSM